MRTFRELSKRKARPPKIESNVRVLEVELEDGRKLLVPRENVELIDAYSVIQGSLSSFPIR